VLADRASIGSLYHLVDLLAFYTATFERIFNGEDAVHTAVQECLAEARSKLTTLLGQQTAALTASTTGYPADLSTTVAVTECSRQVQEVLAVYAAALSGVPSDEDDECHIDKVLGGIVQPLLQVLLIA
jgi:hypothetical protein